MARKNNSYIVSCFELVLRGQLKTTEIAAWIIRNYSDDPAQAALAIASAACKKATGLELLRNSKNGRFMAVATAKKKINEDDIRQSYYGAASSVISTISRLKREMVKDKPAKKGGLSAKELRKQLEEKDAVIASLKEKLAEQERALRDIESARGFQPSGLTIVEFATMYGRNSDQVRAFAGI